MKDKATHKLSPRQRQVVLQMLAIGDQISEIVDEIRAEFGIRISDRAIRDFRSNYASEIQEIRSTLNSRLKESFPFANISARVHAWSKIIETGTIDQKLRALRDLNAAMEAYATASNVQQIILLENNIPGMNPLEGIKS